MNMKKLLKIISDFCDFIVKSNDLDAHREELKYLCVQLTKYISNKEAKNIIEKIMDESIRNGSLSEN